jgi:hypothetical protein
MADAPHEREFKLSGGALKKPRASPSRRNKTRKNIQEGGAAVGALVQLAAQSAPIDQAYTGAQSHYSAAASATSRAMNHLGPSSRALQSGGDNSGALMQVATNPHMGGPINSQRLANGFATSVQDVLATQLGPDSRALQFGGRKQHGGDGIAGTIQIRSSNAPTLPGAPEPVGVLSGVSPEQPAPVGGARRLVLAPRKRGTRIALKAKKQRGGSSTPNNIPPPANLAGGATRKARKIHIRVKGVTSRLAKAKKAKKEAMSCPIGEVRSKLEAAKVIKKGSKAPEAMLRNMYADLLITKKGL